jgi:hypothetical protein
MVSQNYDMCDSKPSESTPDSGPRDFVEAIRDDFLRSSHRSVSETSGTVRHGRFQYLGDPPFEAKDSLRGYNRVSELLVSLFSYFEK